MASSRMEQDDNDEAEGEDESFWAENDEHAAGESASSRNGNRKGQSRIVLLLDLDCFYAQCECVRLGLPPSETSLALLQWNSVLAVTYPARRLYGIKRGDSWDKIRQVSNNQCLAVHVPVLVTQKPQAKAPEQHDESPSQTQTQGIAIGESASSDLSPTGASTQRNKESPRPSSSNEATNATSTTAANATQPSRTSTTNLSSCLQRDYKSVYLLNEQERQEARRRDVGHRRYPSEGKACIERYRVASAKIFEMVLQFMSSRPEWKRTVILERASIDEFFLDVTEACWNSTHCRGTSTVALNQSPHASQSQDEAVMSAVEETVVVGQQQQHKNGESNDTHEPRNTVIVNERDAETRALQYGCYLAHQIRHKVFHTLGFTLSAGIGVNKTLAKLSAGHGKPNGQAVTYRSAMDLLLQQTEIRKCRNLGGKLGSKVQALLPHGVPTTVGSITRYLSLTDLQRGLASHNGNHNQHNGGSSSSSSNNINDASASAYWVYQMARGIDNEPVASKEESALPKSITAFKSLPFRKEGHALEECADWIRLLAQEVVTRVETDAHSHSRYPKSCNISYASGGSRTNKSVRVAFPPQRMSTTASKINKLVEQVPRLIRSKEGSAFRVTRLGLSAVDFIGSNGNYGIQNYFCSSSSTTATATASNADHAAGPSSTTQTLPNNEKSLSTRDAMEVKPSITPPQSRKEEEESSTTDEKDADLELAKKLQAGFDREHRLLQALDNNKKKKKRLSASWGGGSAAASSSGKTRRIDSFFKSNKPL